jgi:hypothetical protein
MVAAGERCQSPAPRAALIGGAAGVLFGLQDALTRFVLADVSHNPFAMLLDWQLYVLLFLAVYGLALMQSAYKAGPLTAGLPPIAVGEPVIGMLIGVFALGEHLRSTTPALAFEAAGAASIIVGTWMLGRSPLVCGTAHPSRLAAIEAKLLADAMTSGLREPA